MHIIHVSDRRPRTGVHAMGSLSRRRLRNADKWGSLGSRTSGEELLRSLSFWS